MTDKALQYTEEDLILAIRSAASVARCNAVHPTRSEAPAPCWECMEIVEKAHPLPKRMIPNVLDDPCDSSYHFRVDPDSAVQRLEYKLKTEGEAEWSWIDRFGPFPERVRVWSELLEHPMVEEP